MKNKISQLLKRFNAWLIRVNDWFKKPSLLSLLISFLVPGFFALVAVSLCMCEPEFASRFLRMSAVSDRVPYEVWVAFFCMSLWFFGWFVFDWISDLFKYIISLFRKSSAPADDK